MNTRKRGTSSLFFLSVLVLALAAAAVACAQVGTPTSGVGVTQTSAGPQTSGMETPASAGAGTTTTVGAGTTTAEGQRGEPLKIGAPLPLTGAYAADGEHAQMGLELAVADLNAAGGLLERPLELETFDIEELLPDTVAASGTYLLDEQNVDVVVETYGGNGPDFEAYGAGSDVPFIHGTGSVRAADLVRSDPGKYGNMFQVFPVEADYGKRAWEGVLQFQNKYTYPNNKVAILRGDLEWDTQYTKGVTAEAAKAGWQVVVDETVPYGTSDWGPVLTKIRAEQPAAVICSVLSVADISSFVKQFMENPTPSLLDISYMVVLDETQEAVGDDLRGVMGYVTSYVTPGPEHDAWKARFTKMFGIDVPLTTAPSAYDSVMIWARAASAVGDATKYKEIGDYIRTHEYTGLLGTYDFNNREQTVKAGPELPIAYAQYLGDGRLAFYGTDPFVFPPYIQPAWPAK